MLSDIGSVIRVSPFFAAASVSLAASGAADLEHMQNYNAEGKPWNSPPLPGYLSRLCPEIQAVSVYSEPVRGLYFSIASELYFAKYITTNYFSTVCSCGFQNTGKLPCHQRLAHYKYNYVIRGRCDTVTRGPIPAQFPRVGSAGAG